MIINVHGVGNTVWLPNENEWYKAAYYKGGSLDAGYWNYATQSDTIPTSEPPPGTDMDNGSANYYDNGYAFTDSVYGYHLTDVGAYLAKPSDSSYGTFDPNGNVWEWLENPYGSLDRVLRGGSYADFPSDTLQSTYRHHGTADGEWYSVGFRIASIPEPCSVILLSLGSLAMLRKRRT